MNRYVYQDMKTGVHSASRRLLHVIDELALGGTEMIMIRVVSRLDPQRFQSQVCAFIPGPVESELQAAALPYVILHKRRAFDVMLLLRLRAWIKRERIDLVHCRSLQGILYGGLAATLARVPFVCNVEGENTLRMQRAVPILRWSAKRSRAMIVVSESLKRSACRVTGVAPERLTVVYNGVDLDKFNTHHSNSDVLPVLRKGGAHAGCVGRLHPVKDHACLFRAIDHVRQFVPNVHLSLIGDGPLRRELSDLQSDLGLRDHISFLGQRDDVARLLPQFDVFVLSSLSEGISIALLEAMAAGLPVVATNVGGNPEVVQHGVTGLLVPPQDSRALADALLQVLSDPEARQAMGRKGRERVEAHFSLSAMARHYGQIYERALTN